MARRLKPGARALLLASLLAGMLAPIVLAGAVTPNFEFEVPVSVLDFGTVPPLQARVYTARIRNCRVRCTDQSTQCYVFAAPYPLDAHFTDPVEEVSFPISQLSVRRSSDGAYISLDNLSPKQFYSVYLPQNQWRNFTCRFRLTMTGNEAAGSYSVMIQLTAAQSL